MNSEAEQYARGGAEQAGWEPSRRGPPPRDGRALTALRTTAYVLTSLASIVFIASAIYGAVQLSRLNQALSGYGGGLSGYGSSPTSTEPGGGFIGSTRPSNELDAHWADVPRVPAGALR